MDYIPKSIYDSEKEGLSRIMNKEVCLVINTPKAKRNYAEDRKTIRKMCLKNKVTYITTLAGALAALKGIESVKHFKKELIEYLSWYNEKRIKDKYVESRHANA